MYHITTYADQTEARELICKDPHRVINYNGAGIDVRFAQMAAVHSSQVGGVTKTCRKGSPAFIFDDRSNITALGSMVPIRLARYGHDFDSVTHKSLSTLVIPFDTCCESALETEPDEPHSARRTFQVLLLTEAHAMHMHRSRDAIPTHVFILYPIACTYGVAENFHGENVPFLQAHTLGLIMPPLPTNAKNSAVACFERHGLPFCFADSLEQMLDRRAALAGLVSSLAKRTAVEADAAAMEAVAAGEEVDSSEPSSSASSSPLSVSGSTSDEETPFPARVTAPRAVKRARAK